MSWFTEFFQPPPAFGAEAHPHEEVAGVGVVELRAVGNVAGLVGEERRDRRDDPPSRPAFDAKCKIQNWLSSWADLRLKAAAKRCQRVGKQAGDRHWAHAARDRRYG